MADRITIVRGNDEEFLVTVKANGLPVNLTDASVRCEVKDAPGGRLLFEAITVAEDPVNGVIAIKFPSSQTANLRPNSVVYFDILLQLPDGSVKNIPNPPFQAVVVERVTD